MLRPWSGIIHNRQQERKRSKITSSWRPNTVTLGSFSNCLVMVCLHQLRSRKGRQHQLSSVTEKRATTLSRSKRCALCAAAVKKYLETIKKEVKASVFDDLLGVVERVTLMFAIDDTGSMGSEIVAVKAIAKYIIECPSRQYTEIDYVLSPFNDPSMYSVFFFRLILSF